MYYKINNSLFQQAHEAALPEAMSGADFLAAHGRHLDTATTVQPDGRRVSGICGLALLQLKCDRCVAASACKLILPRPLVTIACVHCTARASGIDLGC